jgi:Holliday junction resolvasome RuvABC endonuclease subunit
MTLTVRLQPDLESALELHCAERGVTKSLVVQEVLAEYLARPRVQRGARRDAAPAQAAEPSANYRAFEALGLIGCVEGIGPADKAGVRAAITRGYEAKKAKRGARAAQAVAVGPASRTKPRAAR